MELGLTEEAVRQVSVRLDDTQGEESPSATQEQLDRLRAVFEDNLKVRKGRHLAFFSSLAVWTVITSVGLRWSFAKQGFLSSLTSHPGWAAAIVVGLTLPYLLAVLGFMRPYD